jgi:hypothetical protein
MIKTREDLEWLSKSGENKRRKNFKKHERKDQIEHVVLEHLYLSRKAMSALQIARAVDMTPTVRFRAILDEMVDEGRLMWRRFDYRGGKCNERFEYTIPPQKLAAGVAGAVGVGGQQS